MRLQRDGAQDTKARPREYPSRMRAWIFARDLETFWRGIEEQRYDIVQYNQYHYIRSAKDYQVIAHNREFSKSTLAGTLYDRYGRFEPSVSSSNRRS